MSGLQGLQRELSHRSPAGLRFHSRFEKRPPFVFALIVAAFSVVVGVLVATTPSKSLPIALASVAIGAGVKLLIRLPAAGRKISLASGLLACSHIVGWTWPSLVHVSIAISVATTSALLWSVASVPGLRRLRRSPLFYLAALPLGIALIVSVTDGAWNVAAQRLLLIAFVLALLMASESGVLDRAQWASAVAVGFYCGLLVLATASITAPLPSGSSRFSGGYWAQAHPNVIGLMAAVSVVGLLQHRSFPSAETAYLAGTSLLIVHLTGSRTALSMVLVAMAVWLVLTAGRTPSGDRTGYAGRVVVQFAVSLVAILVMTFVAVQFTQHIRQGSTSPLSGRQVIWNAVIETVRASPARTQLLGASSDASGRIAVEGVALERVSAHNAMLAVLRVSGLAGTATFLVGVGLLIRGALKSRERRMTASIAAAALVTIPVETWLFGGTLWMLVACCGLEWPPSSDAGPSVSDKAK